MQNPSPHLSLTPRMIRVIFFTNYIHMWFLTCVLQTWIGQIDTMWVTCYIRCYIRCSSISSNGDVLTLGKIQSDVWTICRLLTVNWSYCFLHGQVIWKKNEKNNKKKKWHAFFYYEVTAMDWFYQFWCQQFLYHKKRVILNKP